MKSLRLRLLLSVTALLVIFFGVTIAVLDRAFRDASERSEQELLDAQLIALLAAAEPTDDQRLKLPSEMPEPRLSAPGSGLYAVVQRRDNTVIWNSPSTLGLTVPWLEAPELGERRFDRLDLADGSRLFSYVLSVDWEFQNQTVQRFSFHVLHSTDSFNAQLASYRRQLFGWFGAVTAGLLVGLAVLFGWLLSPLGRIEREIHEVERGQRAKMSAGYPSELSGVTRNLNALIGSERGRTERYRRTLGDLAHSLKTPLAAARALLTDGGADNAITQIDRMDEIVRYQLNKPAMPGPRIGGAPVTVVQELSSIASGLDKVYRDKTPICEIDADEKLDFNGDRGDFLELAGNLMDNAYKRCARRLVVGAQRKITETGARSFLLQIEDDGPGFPADSRQQLLERGMRLDELATGQGIGLGVVREIVDSYNGSITLGDSTLGGALVSVEIPDV